MTLEDRVRRLEDIEEIRRLRNMFHYFINERQTYRFGEILCEDAVVYFDEFSRQEGLENIIAAAGNIPERVVLKQFIHNHQIELNGDTATGFCYLDARYGDKGESFIVAARYDDKYRRTEAGWKISETRVKILFSVPLQKGWADAGAGQIGRDYFRDLAREFSEPAPAGRT